MPDDTTGDDPAPMKALELEERQLKVAKMRLDLDDQTRHKSWTESLPKVTPVISVLIAIAGFLWGIKQYRDQQERNIQSRQEQFQKEQETAQRELMKPWLEAQRKTYDEALGAASNAANSDDPAEKKKSLAQFWHLYHGRMLLVETKSVSQAMVGVGGAFNRNAGKEATNAAIHRLATEMAKSMSSTAMMTYDQFAENQFKYISDPNSVLSDQ